MINPVVKWYRNYEGILLIILLLFIIAGGYFISSSIGNSLVLIYVFIGGLLYDQNKDKK